LNAKRYNVNIKENKMDITTFAWEVVVFIMRLGLIFIFIWAMQTIVEIWRDKGLIEALWTVVLALLGAAVLLVVLAVGFGLVFYGGAA
jgi:hypothetical protein